MLSFGFYQKLSPELSKEKNIIIYSRPDCQKCCVLPAPEIPAANGSLQNIDKFCLAANTNCLVLTKVASRVAKWEHVLAVPNTKNADKRVRGVPLVPSRLFLGGPDF